MKKILGFIFSFAAVGASLANVVGLESEVYATSDYGITHRLYVTFDSSGDELVAIYGTVGENENSPLSVLSSAPIFNSTLGTNFGEGINPRLFRCFSGSRIRQLVHHRDVRQFRIRWCEFSGYGIVPGGFQQWRWVHRRIIYGSIVVCDSRCLGRCDCR